MEIAKLTATTAAGLALLAATSSAYAQKKWNAPRIVTSYCSGCHGIDGNAQLPYFPKLAGLDAKYAAKKLAAFREPSSPPVDELLSRVERLAGAKNDAGNVSHEERINMEGVAHAANSEAIEQAVIWYSKQRPAPPHLGNKDLAEKGQNVFLHGVPAQKVLPCSTCHGTNAEGKDAAPRLAGQNAEYIEIQLAKFRRGDRTHAPEMTMVTRDLDEKQAHAVAEYLQSR
jgi:cytochrome c553